VATIQTKNFHENLIQNKKLILKSDRSFGLTMGAILAFLGFLSFRHQNIYFYALWPLATLFIILALLMPSRLHLIHIWWIGLGEKLKRITTPIFLSVFFFLFLTPIALVIRICGKDLLGLKKKMGHESYWIMAEEPSSFKDQF